jgi:hypothetical protein
MSRHWLRVSLGPNIIHRYSLKLGVFLVSLGYPETWESVGESSMSSSSIMCPCSSGEESLSVLPPRVMVTTRERTKTGLKIDLSGLRSQVQVSGTPWPKTWPDLCFSGHPDLRPYREVCLVFIIMKSSVSCEVQASGVGLGTRPLWNFYFGNRCIVPNFNNDWFI